MQEKDGGSALLMVSQNGHKEVAEMLLGRARAWTSKRLMALRR